MSAPRSCRALAALLVAAAVATACSSDGGEDGIGADPPSCRLPEDLSRTAVLYDPDPERRALLAADLDARTVTVVCEGLGGSVGVPEAPLDADGVPYSYDPAPANAAWLPVSANLSYAVVGDDLVDLRTGEREAVSVGSVWRPAYPTGAGAVLMASRTATDGAAVIEPSSWCVLPRAGAPVEECEPVPGAVGPGAPVIAATGTVGWAPRAGVPLRAGPITAGTATGAVGRWAVAAALPPDRASRSMMSVWLDAAGTAALIEPSAVDDVIALDDVAPVAWLTDPVLGPDGASGRYVQSPADYEAVGAAGGRSRSGFPLVVGFATDGADSVVLAVSEDVGASLVRVRADSDEPELIWDGRAEGDRLPSAVLVRVPAAGDAVT